MYAPMGLEKMSIAHGPIISAKGWQPANGLEGCANRITMMEPKPATRAASARESTNMAQAAYTE